MSMNVVRNLLMMESVQTPGCKKSVNLLAECAFRVTMITIIANLDGNLNLVEYIMGLTLSIFLFCKILVILILLL